VQRRPKLWKQFPTCVNYASSCIPKVCWSCIGLHLLLNVFNRLQVTAARKVKALTIMITWHYFQLFVSSSLCRGLGLYLSSCLFVNLKGCSHDSSHLISSLSQFKWEEMRWDVMSHVNTPLDWQTDSLIDIGLHRLELDSGPFSSEMRSDELRWVIWTLL